MRIRGFIAAALGLLTAAAAQGQTAANGAEIYLRICSACHGEKGNGDSHAATALASRPRDFSTEAARLGLSRPYMIAIVRDGRPHSAMVGRTERLTQDQIEAVVDFIRTAFMPPEPGTLLARGRDRYLKNCASCHGDRGKGGPRRGAVGAAPPIATSRARVGLDEAAMTEALARERHAPGMTAADLSLDADSIREVVAHVRSAFVEATAGRRPAAPN